MGIQTPTNCGHRADGGVLNPMAGRQIVQRYPNCRDGHIKRRLAESSLLGFAQQSCPQQPPAFWRGCVRRFPPHLESPVPLPSASQPKADKN